MAWIGPGELDRSWHPAFYAPEYLEVDRRLAAASDRYLVLGSIVQFHGQPREIEDRDQQQRWVVRLRRGAFAIEERGEVQPLGRMMALPPEAIIVAKHFITDVPTAYWDESLFPGGGLTPVGTIVLRPLGHESIGWLASELTSDFAQLQIRRSAVGSTLPRIDISTLLEIKVHVPAAEEKRRLSELVRERLRSRAAFETAHTLVVSAKKGVKPVVLTAATFEDRLDQFESYLLEQRIVDEESGFFVEASTTDQASDLFVVRPLRGYRGVSAAPLGGGLQPQDDREVNREWRRWYWNTAPAEGFRLFSSLVVPVALPAHLLARMTARTTSAFAAELRAFTLPGFDFFRQAIEVHRHDVFEEESAKQALASGWLALQGVRGTDAGATMPEPGQDIALPPDDRFAEQLFSWVRSIFRPAVALKVLRHGEVAGVYVLFGPDQIDDPEVAAALLEGHGAQLNEILSQPSEIIDDAARRESLRRLSWVMHQLNGPIGRAANAIEDLQEFLKSVPEVADRLVPNEDKAKARAAMLEQGVAHFTFGARLTELGKAVGDIRNLTYQIRRLRRAQADLTRERWDLADLLRTKAAEYVYQVHDLRIDVDVSHEPVFVSCNPEILNEALAEVLNNACRELKEQAVQQPVIAIKAWTIDGVAWLTIRDNGLPLGRELISNPFEEDASTYAKQGRGSGLGLTIVRETFRAHGGSCRLYENYAEEGARTAGVTFEASLPIVAADTRERTDA